MKKANFILVSIALMTFCLISCKRSESSDLHLLELKGKVKSVTYHTTSDVNSKGKATRKSQRCELETYNLSEDGKITTINYGADHGAVAIRITRNKKGQIETISAENLECDGGNTKKYTWNANGYPINEEYIMIGDLGYTCNILYNNSNEIIGKTYYEYWEEECVREWSENYTVMEVDEQGNWIKRLCKTIGDNIKYSLEERDITYYGDAPDHVEVIIEEPIEKVVLANKLEGKFSVAEDRQVQFSRGNLQYQASTDTWRFAERQWDMIGKDNSNISSTYSGWIDLFGWGTGNNPTLASKHNYNYPRFVDWGSNTITNNGEDNNAWRTLTSEEWEYLIKKRENATNLRGQASVNDVNGYVLLPDNWTSPYGLTFTSNPRDWTTNQYSVSDWSKMEKAGAVFLPATGYRDGYEVVDVNNDGGYWSSSPLANHESLAWYFCFNSVQAYTGDILRFGGFSVRLVFSQEDASSSWIYGTWTCKTPYGTIKIILNDNGMMYNSVDEAWHSYSIESTRIWEQLDGYGSSYPLDRANKRIGTGEPGYWFSKIQDIAHGACEEVNYYDEEPEEVRQIVDDEESNYAEEEEESDAVVEEDDNDVVFVVAESMPEFPGGQQALFKYLNENVKYPAIAKENGIQGRVLCQFTVNKNGSLTDIEVVRSGGDPSLDKEAIRVIKSMPKWKPGKHRGKLVRVQYLVPINFKIQ